MMSISPLKSASNAADYYLKEEKELNQSALSLEKDDQDNYYLKEKSQDSNTFWYGKLAEESGLVGKPVEQKTLESVLSGTLNGETIKGKRENHRSGFDLTFSAPKSVSILAFVGGDTRLIEAHDNAVKFVLSELEKDIAQVKVTHEKGEQEYENTGNLLFAVVRHKTSRENDMQLHSHALAANMTRDQEHELRALATSLKQKGGVINGSGERIYHFQKYYGILYQSQLAKSTQDLGYRSEGVANGQFEIAGVPEKLKDTFSTRKQQIDQHALDLGFDSRAAKDVAALDTRRPKHYESDAALNAKWQQTTRNAGFEPTKLVQSALNIPARDIDAESIAHDAFARAVEHQSQYNTALSLEKVIELAASDFTKGDQQANAIDLKKAADGWIKDGQLIPLSEGLYTTQSALNTEKSLMDVTQGRTHNLRTYVDNATLNALRLSEDNRKKVFEIYHSTKQFHVVNVFGSSEQIAQSLLNAGNHSGKRVQLVSQNAHAAKLNKTNITRDSHNFATWVKHLFIKEQRHTLTGFLHSDAPLTNKDILLVDNAHQMNARELIALTDKAKQSESKVIMLNHVTGRQGFKAHSAISLYSKGNVATHHWVNKKPVESTVRLYDSDIQTIARSYAQLPDKSSVQVLATSGVEQRRLTEAIRDEMKNSGQLSRTSLTLFTQQPHFLSRPQQTLAQHYKPGMTLRTWQDNKPHDFVIAGIDKANNVITTLSKDDNNEHRFDPSSKEFQSMNMQLYKPDRLELAKGERITTTGKHYEARLGVHERYVVTKLSQESVTLLSPDGQSKTVHPDSLKDAPLQYDYVQPATKVEPRTHTLLSGKAFTLSKELLSDITSQSERVDIFTDNTDKAQRSLEKSDVHPSAIERVIHTQPVNERYLSDATQAIVKKDIEIALSVIAKEQNASVQEKAVNFALNHLSQREAAFSQKALVIEAVRYAFEETNAPVTKQDVEAQLAARRDTLSAEYSDGTRWTTQAALDIEKHILTNIEQGKGKHPPFAPHASVQQYLNTQPWLTEGQKNAIHLISTTRDSFVAIQGLAGTGKSTMLESNIALIKHTTEATENAPQRVLGLAPTHSAVGELKSKGVEAQTLESLLTDLRRGNTSPRDYQNSLLFLDESSMVSNRQASELTDLVLQSGSKLVSLGDTKQLLSLNAGKPFELSMTKGLMDSAQVIESENMTDIIRQKNPETLGAVHNILDKQPASALDKLTQQAPDTVKSEHVISTLDESMPDKRTAQLMATEKLSYEVAQDYLARTPRTRDETLIIAYTNLQRDNITEHIRAGLIKEGELGKENVVATRLRSIGASGEELKTMMPYQKGLVLSTRPGHYATITKVDSENGVVMIQNPDTGKETLFLPRNRDHKFTALYSVSLKPLSENDKIITRFTDKSRDIKANEEYRITGANNSAITAQSRDGKTLSIDPDSLNDGHWDYAYTRTADMAQGATYPYVITAIQGKGMLTDMRRAYIDLSRASTHVRLYTDNPKAMMKSWLSKETNKASAIETVQQIAPQTTTYFNDSPLVQEDIRYQNKNGDFDYQLFKERIDNELPKYTESLAEQLLGEPNRSKSDMDYLTFGTGKTAIKVTLTGQYRGYFKDYTTGEKGSLINLIMSHKDMTYKEAMTEAHNMLNAPDKHQLIANEKHEVLINTTPRHIAKFEERAKEYMKHSQSIEGTLVERYLNKHGIENPSNEHVRFHPAVYSSEDKAEHPAMVTNIHNQSGETKSIAVLYLDDDGNKDSKLDINPRILGSKSKNLTEFHQGTELNTTIISTSIENSFIIKKETDGQYDIINVCHKNDIQNISTDALRQHIIIVLSEGNHDLNPNNIEKIMSNFHGRDIHFMSSENIHQQIRDHLDKIDSQDENLRHELNDKETPKSHQEIDSYSDQHKNHIDSKELEHFDSNEESGQQNLNLEIIDDHERSKEKDIEREMER